jgi:hypothetical protein
MTSDFNGRTQTEGAESISESNEDEVTGSWRNKHDEEIQLCYRQGDQMMRMRQAA